LADIYFEVSNYVIAPTAEPVIPCSVDLLNEMIRWLELDMDIVAQQEPRIDFVRGSILGKTSSMAGGTSVDLCKQVVGPKGIGPILDAVGKNSHIDRFLLGNNIVGNEGAKVIANFIASEKSKRVYNFYVRRNRRALLTVYLTFDRLLEMPSDQKAFARLLMLWRRIV
jgi:hypothetical protein